MGHNRDLGVALNNNNLPVYTRHVCFTDMFM